MKIVGWWIVRGIWWMDVGRFVGQKTPRVTSSRRRREEDRGAQSVFFAYAQTCIYRTEPKSKSAACASCCIPPVVPRRDWVVCSWNRAQRTVPSSLPRLVSSLVRRDEPAPFSGEPPLGGRKVNGVGRDCPRGIVRSPGGIGYCLWKKEKKSIGEIGRWKEIIVLQECIVCA